MEDKLDVKKTEEVEIDLIDLGRYFFSKWVPVVALALAGAVLGFVITAFVLTPVYEAKSSVYVVSAAPDTVFNLSDINIGTSLANDYKHLVSSRTLMERVIAETGYDLTPDELSRMLKINNEAGTRILEFTVRAENPEQAMKLANSFAGQSVIYLPEILGVRDVIPRIIDSAVLPDEPENIKTFRNTIIGALAGFAVSAVVLTVMYFISDTSSEKAENKIGSR